MSAFLKKYKPTQNLVVKGRFGAVNIPDVPNAVLERFNKMVNIEAKIQGISPAEVFEQMVRREGERICGKNDFDDIMSSSERRDKALQNQAIKLGFYEPPDNQDGP